MLTRLIARLTARSTSSFLPSRERGVARIGAGAEGVSLCSRADAADILGGDGAVDDAIRAGSLLELPATVTAAEAAELLSAIAVVSTNGVAVSSHTGDVVDLAVVTGEPVRVSKLLYEVLRRSITGTVPLPTVVERVALRAAADGDKILLEAVRSLRALLASGAVMLTLADLANEPERLKLIPAR